MFCRRMEEGTSRGSQIRGSRDEGSGVFQMQRCSPSDGRLPAVDCPVATAVGGNVLVLQRVSGVIGAWRSSQTGP